jgi:hypothetical protein
MEKNLFLSLADRKGFDDARSIARADRSEMMRLPPWPFDDRGTPVYGNGKRLSDGLRAERGSDLCQGP